MELYTSLPKVHLSGVSSRLNETCLGTTVSLVALLSDIVADWIKNSIERNMIYPSLTTGKQYY
jgi:hypothetical protein